MFDNDIDDDSQNTFKDYGSDIKNDSDEDWSKDWIQFFPLICTVNVVVYQRCWVSAKQF